MKTLEEIKYKLAKDAGFDDWEHLCFHHGNLESIHRFDKLTEFMNEVAKRYAQQCCEDLRERIADSVKLKPHVYPDGYISHEILVLDKNSIRNVEIILP